jgi:hypothetical protein
LVAVAGECKLRSKADAIKENGGTLAMPPLKSSANEGLSL